MQKQYYKKIKILSWFVLEKEENNKKEEYLFLMNWLKYFEFSQKINCNSQTNEIKDLYTVLWLEKCRNLKIIMEGFLADVIDLIYKTLPDNKHTNDENNYEVVKLFFNKMLENKFLVNKIEVPYIFYLSDDTNIAWFLDNSIVISLGLEKKIAELFINRAYKDNQYYNFPYLENELWLFLDNLSKVFNTLKFSEQAFLNDFEMFFQKWNTFSNLIWTKEEEQFKKLLSYPTKFLEWENTHLFDSLLRKKFLKQGNINYVILDKFYTTIEFSKWEIETEVPTYDYFYFPRTNMLVFKLKEGQKRSEET